MTDAAPPGSRPRRSPGERRRNNLIVLVALLFGLVVGLTLVVFGGDDADDAGDGPALTGGEQPESPELDDTRGVLPLDDVDYSVEGIEDYTGLSVPGDATEFRTARLDNDRQLDVTFLFPTEAESAFLEASQLPEPVAGQRVALHGSALWELNPPEGVELRGATDTYDDLRRAFELVEEEPGVLRARIVITTA